MKNNIYDLVISELVAQQGAATGGSPSVPSSTSTSASVVLTTLGSTNIMAGTDVSFDFTSSVYNLPTGYTIDSHTVTTVTSGIVVTTNAINTVTNDIVNIPSVGGTYVVVASVLLVSAGNPDITISDVIYITSVASISFGLLPLPSSFVLNTLQAGPLGGTYTITNGATVGRIIFAAPVGVAPIKRIVDNHGMEMIISDMFTVTTATGYQVYTLNYDTQIVSGPKTFTIKY